MSRTDKTRPYEVAYNDPRNRRFRMVGITDYSGTQRSREWTYKPITSCKSSKCCYKDWHARDRKKERIAVRRELRSRPVE